MGVGYEPTKDGTIEDYIRHCKDEWIPITFKSYSHYKILWNKGYVDPQIACIRLCTSRRPDESYIVIDENEAEGIDLPPHKGKPGIHKINELLNYGDLFEYYEVSPLNPHPTPRKK